MSYAIRGGAAESLVVEPGDRVCAEGRFVRFAGADWLDLAQVNDLVARPDPWKSDRSVRLVGAAAPAIAGWITVTGVWRDDVIEVEFQSPVESSQSDDEDPLLALPAPSGGWDVVGQSTNIDGLEELRDTGKVVRDGWLRDDSNALILRVAASDVDAVERVLAPQLPRRLCIVPSRYIAAHLHEVETMFTAHYREWTFEAWSYEDMDAQCQPCADATLTRVSADFAAWADTLPDDLLTVDPAMTPVS